MGGAFTPDGRKWSELTYEEVKELARKARAVTIQPATFVFPEPTETREQRADPGSDEEFDDL